MEDNTEQVKLLATALYELRQLLTSHLRDEDVTIQTASRLAYALHNEALAIKEGKTFDIDKALEKIRALDKIAGDDYSDYFIEQFRNGR